MKTVFRLSGYLALGLSFAVASSAYAATGAELAQKNACMACHSVDKKVVGPAFKDITKKYKANADASAYLAKKIKDGSTGVWGSIPMPPNSAKVNDADAKLLADYILSLN